MVILRAILLGILQAFTESFPLSNTAHIMFLQQLFNYHKTYMAYDIVIDAGTLIAIGIYYARDVVQMIKQAPVLLKAAFTSNKSAIFSEFPHALALSLILVSCAATAISRYIFMDTGEAVTRGSLGLGAMWVVMGILLAATKKMKQGTRTGYEMNHQDAFVIGLAQGLTVFNGISRIGITIFFALALGIERKEAARYSFLLGIPYILAALVYKFLHGAHFYQSDQAALLVSFIVTIFAGVGALALSVRLLQSGKYYICSFYCFSIGTFSILYSLLSRSGF